MMNHRAMKLLVGSLIVIGLAWGLRPSVGQDKAQTGAALQNQVQVEADVVYGEAGGQKLLLDVFRPAGPLQIRPAVVLVHGGGWSAGNKNDFHDLAVGLTGAGYVSFSVGYRLATSTSNKYPAQLDDVQRAVRWIRLHAAQYGVDRKRIGALGASAGGHLVALLGTSDTRDNSDKELAAFSSRVTCVVDLFGPTDFTGLNAGLSPDARSIVLNFLGKSRDEAPDLYRDASPITHIDHSYRQRHCAVFNFSWHC